VAAVTNPHLHQHRRNMKEWARTKFSWVRAGLQWDYIFQKGVTGQHQVDIDQIAPLDKRLHYTFAYPPSPPALHSEL